MSLSIFITSAAHFLLIANYLAEGKYRDKWRLLWSRKSVLVFLILIGVHFLWLINTADFDYAFNDIRIKLPLLALPVIVGTSSPLTFRQTKIIMLTFVVGVFANTIIATVVMLSSTAMSSADDFREVSLFVSHIRLSLMIVLSVFILIWFIIKRKVWNLLEYYIYSFLALWFVIFIVLSQFFTGIVLLFSVGILFLLWRIWLLKEIKYQVLGYLAVAIILLLVFTFAFFQIRNFYTPPVRGMTELLSETSNGNFYYHDRKSKVLENGNLVYVEISEIELRQAWELRSRLSFDSLDARHQPVMHTLIRYLASKGLTKDADAVMSLSDSEIMAIEDGVSNIRFADGISFLDKVYQLIWQIDFYIKEGNPSGHSITQRIEFIKTGFYILGKNFFTGVGTGDVDDAFQNAYSELNSSLLEPFRHRAHNQILTFYISFGALGGILCLIAMFFPIILENQRSKYFIYMFFAIAFISMLNEDTLETATGSAFFAYFYSLFLWGFNDTTE